jgi:tetratricopeptide (TPR) repeat protein
VAIDARYGIANQVICQSYALKGEYEQAFEWYSADHRQAGASAGDLQAVKTAYAKAGWRGILQHEIEELKQEEKKGVSNYSALALLYAQLGDREQAFRCLEKAYENRESWLVASFLDPEFDPLRSDPRFDELLKRIGLKS